MLAVITGASKGLGKAIAHTLAQAGYDLAICARDPHTLKQTQESLQAANPQTCILSVPCDLSNPKAVQAFGQQILDTFSSIDILVHNAGQFLPGTICEEPLGRLESLIGTNVYSAYHLTRILAPLMKTQGHGLMVFISSVAGLQAYPNGGAYSISKFALSGLAQNLRRELMPFGIKVSTLYPGATMSDSWAGSGVSPERIMEANDMAEVILSLTKLSPQAVAESIVLRPLLGDL